MTPEEFFKAVAEEYTKARTKFPTNKYKLASLMEESGEVSNAFLQNEYGKGSPEHIWKECVQVASCALRLATEGDSSFPAYKPEELKL